MNTKQFVLQDHKSAQCHVTVIHDGSDIEEIQFISYSTLVIRAVRLINTKFLVECSGTYSPTTSKQISWFLREYFNKLSYYDMKKIAKTGESIVAELTKLN